jgi:hypothetical protein
MQTRRGMQRRTLVSLSLVALSLAACVVASDEVEGEGDPELEGEAASGYEKVPADEAASTKTIVTNAVARLREATAKTPPPARRDAHFKSQGCVKAKFEVEADVPADLRVGVLATKRSYDAWIRFSNGRELDDRKADVRGMAIKLVGVPGTKLAGAGLEPQASTQDFLLASHPTFAVKNAKEFVEFQRIMARDGDPKWFFLSPWRVREALNAKAATGKIFASPLDAQFHSMVASLWGSKPVKLSARPCGGQVLAKTAPDRPNFLGEALKASLGKGDACFEFLIQSYRDPRATPVEDPTVEWKEKDAPFRKVATIRIPKQVFDSPAQLAHCENLSFTPFHTLPVHRPLGGISRVRREVYTAIASFRRSTNGVDQKEPTDLSVPAR